MNTTEHLVACLAEECAEVAKECGKALRFGLDDKVTRDPTGPRGTEGPTNAEKIQGEMVDLLAIYLMAIEAGILPSLGVSIVSDEIMVAIRRKQNRVRAYMDYAETVGALGPE